MTGSKVGTVLLIVACGAAPGAMAQLAPGTKTLVDAQSKVAVDALNAAGSAMARAISAQRRVVLPNAANAAHGAEVAPAAAEITAAADASADVEEQLQSAYSSIERSCATNLAVLSARQASDQEKSAHVNAWGALVALIGGVTVYAPAKVLLMGIGISSSGGSNSVLGGLASSVSADATASKAAIDALKLAYAAAVNAYDAIPVVQDSLGIARYKALTRIQASCDGLLATAAAPAPADPGSGAGH